MLSWKIWKKRHKYLILIFLVLLGACSSLPTPPSTPPRANDRNWFKWSPADEVIFYQGISYLEDNKEKAADYVKAKEAFNQLLKTYPKSKWRGLSETFMHLIDMEQLYEEQCRSDLQLIEKVKGDNVNLLKENDEAKKDNRRLLEESAKLIQENEELKKDIQLLKSLEVQLEKREKMLR